MIPKNKISQHIFNLCGGWWSAMSGAVSIPLGFIALFWGSQRVNFTILAFVGLFMFGVSVVANAHKREEAHKQEMDKLLAEIAALKDKTKQEELQKEQRNELRGLLTDFLLKLDGQIRTVKQINSMLYTGDNEQKAIIETNNLVTEIYAGLYPFDALAATIFSVVSEKPMSETAPYFDPFDHKKKRWEWHLSYLENYKTELLKICEKYK